MFLQEFGALIGAAVLLLLKKSQDKLPGEGSHPWIVAGGWAVGREGMSRWEFQKGSRSCGGGGGENTHERGSGK